MNYKYITADGHTMMSGESMYRITNSTGAMFAVPQKVEFLRKTKHNGRDASMCPYDEKLIHYFDEKKAQQAIAKVVSPVEEVVIPIEPMPELYGNGHHRKNEVKVNGVNLVFAGCITGCGLLQMYGISMLPLTTTPEQFQQAIEAMEKDYGGGVIATLGNAYYKFEPLLLSFGFELVSEYRNPMHTRGTQKLYFLKLNKNNQ